MLRHWKKSEIILLVLLSAVLIYSGVSIGRYFYDGYSSRALNEEFRKEYYQLRHADSGDPVDPFESLLERNKDVVGWIKIPGTEIDYPVVQAEDNEFYLKRNLKKESSSRGSIFMDYRNSNDEMDYNTILYGHNMKDGGMFAGLSAYKDRSFYVDHAFIEYDSPQKPMKWQIFSVYITEPKDDLLKVFYDNDVEYAQYLDMIISKSIYETGVKVTKDDRILTLVTCSYEYENARLVIHAKRAAFFSMEDQK
jgi:sortase B